MEDVEKIVNELNRQNAIREHYAKAEAKRRSRMLDKALAIAVSGMLLAGLSAYDLVSLVIAVPGCLLATTYAAFQLGRWYESVRWNNRA